MMETGGVIFTILNDFYLQVAALLPKIISGLIVLLAGILIADVLKKLIFKLLTIAELNQILAKIKVVKDKELGLWARVISEIVRWTVLILFLVPTAEIWGIPKVTQIFIELLLYIPNVFAAVVIGFIGIVIAKLVYDLIKRTMTTAQVKSKELLASLAKYALQFFTALVVLNQLGIAADLVRTLFTGIVAMLAIAGGLAFGLGGKSLAEEILKDLKSKLKS